MYFSEIIKEYEDQIEEIDTIIGVVVLDAICELSGFAPYAFDGANEGMIRDKLREVGEKLLEASND